MKSTRNICISGLLMIVMSLIGCNATRMAQDKTMIELKNPIIPGYFADPSIVQYEGKFYMYVTADPWGTDFLSCWESDDFQNWKFNELNWPTKQACTSSLSNKSKVWAPSVVRRGDMFYMYVSVGAEVWCGKAKHPLGPWENMLGEQQMIPFDTTKYYHAIDAEAFIDDDGKVYLYWGSGWNWRNGHCYVAELNDDMCSFKAKPIEVTPTHYFEGPLMVKHNGKYYLTYSEGRTLDATYKLRYAVGDSPFGPFIEATNSPVLVTNDSLQVYGPGHHTIFSYANKDYVLYHRHRLPFEKNTAFRQTCLSELTFDDTKNEINTIIPYHTQVFPDLRKEERKYIYPKLVTASSSSADYRAASNVLDNDNTTRWEADNDDGNANLQFDFKGTPFIKTMEIRFEYPWKNYFVKVEILKEGVEWISVADYTKEGISGSPIEIRVNEKCKALRLSFIGSEEKNVIPSIWEVCFF